MASTARRPLNVIDSAAPCADIGPDHSWFPWNPLPTRRPIAWPRGAKVAVCVVLDLGAAEWDLDRRSPVPPSGGRGPATPPDFPRLSHREFGHRVGVFRLLDVLSEIGAPSSAAVDVLTAEYYPTLMRRLRPAVSEIVARGLSANRPITSIMGADEERHYIATTTKRLAAVLGASPSGWLGPEHCESERTLGLLAEHGVAYVADWGNDEQPYHLASPRGDLWMFPLSWELSDLNAVFLRNVSPTDYAKTIVDAFEVMRQEGARSGRLLALHLHPWLSGQAFRIAALRAAIAHVVASPDAWVTTPSAVVQWCSKAD